MNRLLAGALVALTSFGMVASAHAAPQTRYFTCDAQTRLTNLTEPAFEWSATAPTTALQDGGGCLSVDYEAFTATFGGTYSGEVAKLDLTLYSVASNPAYVPDIMDIAVAVDGETVWSGTEVQGSTQSLTGRPRDFKTTWEIADIFVPESTTPKRYEITVTDPYFDDFAIYGRGASDLPSGVTLYNQLDLPPEPEEGEE